MERTAVMPTRRDFLKTSSLLALAPSVPAFLAKTARAAAPATDGRVLVVIQLGGGNDGINTVVPCADEGYARARRELRLARETLLKISDSVGWHPAMQGAARLFDSGRLAIVQGVGYPNPSRSHEVSMAVWQTARFDAEEHKSFGWIGRALDAGPRRAAAAPGAMLIGNESPPVALRGRRSAASALSNLDDFMLNDPLPPVGLATESEPADIAAFIRRSALDARTTAERLNELAHRVRTDGQYPPTELARRLSLAARLVKAGFETPIYYVIQPGYDTHAVQLPAHANLLRELSGGLLAFLDDLAISGLAERVAVLVFSEFGRRVEENGSLGTDHGTAAPVFLAGAGVKAGLIGAAPSLVDLVDGDLKMSIDFRRVYASVLEQWLGIPSADILGEKFEPLAAFKK